MTSTDSTSARPAASRALSGPGDPGQARTGSGRGGMRTRSDEILLWIGTAVVFVPGVLALAQRWASAEYFQHGFLVPVVSLASAHPRIRGLGPSERHSRALVGLAVALAVYALGAAAAEAALQGLALVGALASLVAYR